MKKQVEIMSPAGSFESLRAALDAGADSVYFGVEQLNMRARSANNFLIEDLPKIVELCKRRKVRTYLTVNTILYDHDIELMRRICNMAKTAGVSAVIASDIAAISYAYSIGLEVHISTQANISNIEAVKFYAQFADVVVLARELTLKQIEKVCQEIREKKILGPHGKLVEVEIFAHGALCVAISGKCYMSLATYNSSANRGACLQNCRHSYRVIDEETGDELVIDNKYIMSPKDLCTISFIDKILAAGISVLKLEGRGRSADYVYTVTRVYREAADAVLAGKYTKATVKNWKRDLDGVFNRGFWEGGYYLGKKLGEWSGVYGSKSSKEKVYVGKARKYFPKAGIGEFVIDTGELNKGENIIITGPNTGIIYVQVKSLHVNDRPSDRAVRGDIITFPVDKRVRKNDKIFIIKDRKYAKNNSL